MENIKVGDKVKTLKGDQYNKSAKTEILEVLEINKKWQDYPAIICLRPNGKKSMFLLKNIYKI